MSEKLIFNCTYGKEDPERATLPFVAANIAATAGQDAVVLCTIEAVWLGTEGGTDGIAQPGPAGAGRPLPGVRGQRWPGLAVRRVHEAPGITEEQVRKGCGDRRRGQGRRGGRAGAKTVAFA